MRQLDYPLHLGTIAQNPSLSLYPELWPDWAWSAKIDPTAHELVDSTGNHSGTRTNQAQPENDYWTFDGAADYIDCQSNVLSVPSSSTLTLACWVRWPVSDFHTMISLCDNDGGDTQQHKLALTIDSTHHVNAVIQENATTVQADSPVLNKDRWYHVAATFAESGGTHTINLYIDGQFSATASGSASPSAFTKTLIGATARRNGAIVGEMNGDIADPLIYDRGLLPAEIALLASLPFGELFRRRPLPILPDYIVAATDTGGGYVDLVDLHPGTIARNSSLAKRPGFLDRLSSAFSANIDQTAHDQHGTNHLSFNGNAASASEAGGRCWTFDGTGDYLRRSSPKKIDNVKQLTLCLWMHIASLPSTAKNVVDHYQATGNQRSWTFITENTGFLRWAYSSDGKAGTFGHWDTNSAVLTADEWHHVAVIHDGVNSEIRFYVDGIEKPGAVVTGSSPSTLFASTANLTIGADDNAANAVTAELDDVLIYRRALRDAEILELASLPRGEWARPRPLYIPDVTVAAAGGPKLLTLLGVG